MDEDSSYTRHNILLESGTNEVEFLEFFLGESRYGVNVAKVSQVLVYDQSAVAKLPANSHPSVVGTTVFRDEPILVVDLLNLLNPQQSVEPSHPQLLLVLEFNRCTSGFIISKVNRIKRVNWTEFKRTDEDSFGHQAEMSAGIVESDGGLTLILDFETLLGKIIPSINPETFQENVTELQKAKGRNVKVVYCEDSNIVRSVALRAFKKAGINDISVFGSGEEGYEYLLANAEKEAVDIIITDIEMPLMDGLTLCRKLKENPSLAHIPVVFFSSTISEQMKQKCESVGGTAAYSKPEIDKLIVAFDDLL